MDNVTRPSRDYEMMTILLPDMAEEDTQAALEKVRGYITDVNAEITNLLTDSPWGRRRLAYTIRHEGVDYRDGYYSVIYFTAQPNVIGEIEREMKLDTNIIRYLLVSHDPKAGEKNQDQPAAAPAEAATEEAAAEAPAATEAPAVTEEPAAEAETPTEEAAVEAPASEETTDAETETAVEETAETIEGEEEPAPADGAAAEAEETKES